MLERLNTDYLETQPAHGSALGDFVSAGARTMAQPFVGVSQVLHEGPLHLPQLEIDQPEIHSGWSKAGVIAGTAVDFLLASKCVKSVAKLPSETSRLASAIEMGATGALYEGVSPVDSNDTNFLRAKLSHMATGFGTMFAMGLTASELDKTKMFGVTNSRTLLQETSLQGLSGAVAGITNSNLEAWKQGKTASFGDMGSAALRFGLFGATIGSMQNMAGRFRAEPPRIEEAKAKSTTAPTIADTQSANQAKELSVRTTEEVPKTEFTLAERTSAISPSENPPPELVQPAKEVAPTVSPASDSAIAQFKPSFPRQSLSDLTDVQLYKGSPTEEAMEQSNMFLSGRTLFGRMRDGIHLNSGAEGMFTMSGTMNHSQFASVVFDESQDPILRSFIKDAHTQLGHLTDTPPALVEELGRYVGRSLNADKMSGEQLTDWTEKFLSEHKGETLAAGEFLRQGKAICEQSNAFLKKLGDSFRLTSRLRDGYVARDGGEFQRHMWTEFDFGENRYRVFDPAQGTYNVPVKDVYPNSVAPGYEGPVYKPHGKY